jgi:hypothetical protein
MRILTYALTESNLKFNPGGVKKENSDQVYEKFERNRKEL